MFTADEPTPLVKPFAEGVLSGDEGVYGGPMDVGVGVRLLLVLGVEMKLFVGERLGTTFSRGTSSPEDVALLDGGGKEIGCPPMRGPIIMLIEFR